MVYIVIPMYPEGFPETETVQMLLDAQFKTMEMMYSMISEVLKKKRTFTTKFSRSRSRNIWW